MEKILVKIEEYIREIGTFKIEDVDTRRVVKYNGHEIKYFDLDCVRVDMPNKSEYVFYKDLDEDTLLEILYIIMEFNHKLDEWDKDKYEEGRL